MDKKSILQTMVGVVVIVMIGLGLYSYFQRRMISKETTSSSNIRIGFSLGDLREERWQRDRDFFVASAKKQGAYVQVTSANSDPELQNKQVENFISQGVDVIVIAPYDSEKISEVIEKAHKANIKVLSYDRLIKNSDVDFYLSFDNVKVGYLEAMGVTAVKNKGNFAYIGGAPTDNNATLLKKGSMEVLNPLVKKGDVKIVIDKFMTDWKPEEAYKTIKEYLAKGGKLDAVVAANDGTAFGAIRALKEFGLAGKIPVSGQDAELSACQRVVEGTQTVTVYKPIKALAEKAVEIALDLANENDPVQNNKTDNGKYEVPSFFLEPVVVTKENMDETVIKDGFHLKSEVYKFKK